MTNEDRYVMAREKLDKLIGTRGGQLESCQIEEKYGRVGFSFPKGKSRRKYIVRFVIPSAGTGVHTDNYLELVSETIEKMLDCLFRKIEIVIEITEEKRNGHAGH